MTESYSLGTWAWSADASSPSSTRPLMASHACSTSVEVHREYPTTHLIHAPFSRDIRMRRCLSSRIHQQPNSRDLELLTQVCFQLLPMPFHALIAVAGCGWPPFPSIAPMPIASPFCLSTPQPTTKLVEFALGDSRTCYKNWSSSTWPIPPARATAFFKLPNTLTLCVHGLPYVSHIDYHTRPPSLFVWHPT